MELFKKVQILTSPIQGKGIFARTDLKVGEAIFTAKGPFIRYPFLPNSRKGPHWLNIGNKMWMMPLEKTPWRYINHSCEPNAGLHGRTQVVAMQAIKAGQEILIDYSITESHPDWEMKCLCRNANCRSSIRSIQFLPWSFYERYEDFIPTFLKRSYLKDKIYPTHKKSHGVFAKQAIKKGELLFKVDGPVVEYRFPPNYRLGPHWLAVGKQKWIIPLENNPWNFLKHSCEPNTGLLNKNEVVAMRDILPGQELTMDDSITEADPRWKKPCTCGQKNCRKIIRSIQFLPAERFKKYEPYLSTFAKAVYHESRSLFTH